MPLEVFRSILDHRHTQNEDERDERRERRQGRGEERGVRAQHHQHADHQEVNVGDAPELLEQRPRNEGYQIVLGGNDAVVGHRALLLPRRQALPDDVYLPERGRSRPGQNCAHADAPVAAAEAPDATTAVGTITSFFCRRTRQLAAIEMDAAVELLLLSG